MFFFINTGKLHLKSDCDTYNYLNQSGCTKVDTIDDKKDFLVVEVGASYWLYSQNLGIWTGVLWIPNFGKIYLKFTSVDP